MGLRSSQNAKLCIATQVRPPNCGFVSVFGSGGKYVLVLHTYVLREQYSCGVVLVFWFWWEIAFGVTYVLSVTIVRLCQFFGCGGK